MPKQWWFGQETKFQWVPAPATGAQINNVGRTDSMQYANGRIGVSRSMQTHKEIALEFPVQEATGASGLDAYTRYANGYWGDCDSYPIFFADPMNYDQNLFPPNWAAPGLVKRGWADISPNFGKTYYNLAINPSAETNLTNWAAINGTSGVTTLTRSELGTNAPAGRYVARTTWTTATTVVSGGISYTGTPVTAGSTYGFQITVRSSKIQRVQMTVRFRDAGAVSVGTSVGTATVLAATTNTLLEIPSATVPVSAVTADIEVIAVAGTSGTNWAIGNTFDGDAVVIALATEITPTYFDGDTPGAAWQGTPNASSSFMYISRRTPVVTATAANSYNQPPWSATFQIENTATQQPLASNSVPYALIPIPPGYALWLGYSGSVTGTACVRVDVYNSSATPAYDSIITLSPQSPTGSTRLQLNLSGYDYAKIYLTRTTSVTSSITITSMMAQLWPTGVTPPLTGSHIEGRGTRGLKFGDDATVETYVMVDRDRNVPVHYKGMSTTLIEAQDRG